MSQFVTTAFISAFTLDSAGGGSALGQFVEGDVTVIEAIQGENPNDSFGLEVMAVSDFNSDGAMEFLVSAPGNDEGANNAGKVYLYDGATRAIIRTHVGVRANEALRNVMAAGDVNSDGVMDYLAGSGDGFVYVYSGADGSELHALTGSQANEAFGFRSAGIEDINGDGYDDLLVGAWSNDAAALNAGRVYVISGADGSAIRTHEGASANTRLGHTVVSLGDIDGDGVADYYAGAPETNAASRPGEAYIYSGATGLEIYSHLEPLGTGLNYGSWEPAGARMDFNGDGRLDFAVADISDSALGTETGRIYVYDGPTGSLLYTLSPPAAWSGLGGMTPTPEAHIGDVDGDGIADLLTGSWRSRIGALDGGRADIYSGCSGAHIRSITSNQVQVYLAGSRSGIGDANSDGLTDFILGANGTNGATGAVYVIAGQDHTIMPGDIDRDNDVDLDDFALFESVLAGPDVSHLPSCMDADLNRDGMIDLIDYAILQQVFIGV